MRKKHADTLSDVFRKPVPFSIKWSDIEALFATLGAQITEGRGSRVRIFLNGKVATFHRPHPKKETDKGAVNSVREFLKNAGIDPEEQNL